MSAHNEWHGMTYSKNEKPIGDIIAYNTPGRKAMAYYKIQTINNSWNNSSEAILWFGIIGVVMFEQQKKILCIPMEVSRRCRRFVVLVPPSLSIPLFPVLASESRGGGTWHWHRIQLNLFGWFLNCLTRNRNAFNDFAFCVYEKYWRASERASERAWANCGHFSYWQTARGASKCRQKASENGNEVAQVWQNNASEKMWARTTTTQQYFWINALVRRRGANERGNDE